MRTHELMYMVKKNDDLPANVILYDFSWKESMQRNVQPDEHPIVERWTGVTDPLQSKFAFQHVQCQIGNNMWPAMREGTFKI